MRAPSALPATPNSWYAVAWSHEVRPGQAIATRCFGRDLVVFRGESGTAYVLDSVCPHLGAHLGVGGRVQGDTLVCRFHQWRFDGTGTCVDIPYARRIPPAARVAPWPTTEVNGAIVVWYHDRRAAPDFSLPMLPMGDPSRWARPVYASIDVRTHIQDMNENVFDFAHFVSIHHYCPGAEPQIEIDGPYAHATLSGSGRLHGVPYPAETKSSMYGAGLTVIHMRKPIEFAVIVLKTPIDETVVRHRYAVVVPRRVPGADQVLARLLRQQVTADVRADAEIWANKHYLGRPVLVREDGPILRFRKWHTQFHSAP